MAVVLSKLLMPLPELRAQESRLELGLPRNITSKVSLYRDFGVEVGPDGAIFIANSGDAQIVKLSFEGEPVWRAGGEGEGPGEFRLLYRLAVGPEGDVAAFDVSGANLSWFAADGTFVRRSRLQTRAYAVGNMALLADGLVAMVAYVPQARQHSIHVFDMDGQLLRSFGPVPPVQDELQRRDWLAGFLSVQGPDLLFTMNIPYEIHRFSPHGEPLQLIRRDYEFTEGPGGEAPRRDGERVRFFGRPKFVPHPLGAKGLGGGWLIAGVTPQADRWVWDIFHHGDLVESYPAPNGWVVVATDPDRGVLYVRSEDAAGDRVYLQVPYVIE